MALDFQYCQDGIRLRLDYAGESMFPVPMHVRNDNFSEWEKVNSAEQLWYDGLLTFDGKSNTYLLSTESYYLLDEEVKRVLGFPEEKAELNVYEAGNIGSKNYQIFWEILIGNRPGGRVTRNGNIVCCAGNTYALNHEQYQLVEWIDSYDPETTGLQEKGQYHAKTVFLAKRANASIDDFMTKREFLFSDNADYELVSSTPQEIRFVPRLENISLEIQNELPNTLSGSVRMNNGTKRSTLFISKEAREKYNEINKIPDITGTQVPAFLDNPLSYLPDTIEFDSDEYSKRVKGLRIRKSTAVPYVKIEEATDQPGWFDVETGLVLRGGNEDEEEVNVDSEQILELMEEAASNEEEYIFYQDQWIKIPSDLLNNYIDAEKKLQELGGRRIQGEDRRLILDIYDNLNGVEYNEALLEYRNLNPFKMLDNPIPSCFAGKLFDYQKEGYGFIRAHFETNTGVLLADDMGLGKTVQIIAFLAHLFSQNILAPALLVMPKTLVENWESEINKFLPAERSIYKHQGPYRLRNAESIKRFDIVLTTYETLSRDQTLLGKISWSCVICDEAQKIKNFRTIAATAIKGMNTKCRIAITGTPVENRLSELWSIVDFAQPGLLDSYQSFWKNYEKPISSKQDANGDITKSLIDKLSPIFLRRRKEDELADKLPTKTEYPINVPIDFATEKLYKEIVRNAKESEDPGMMLAIIQKLIMLCSHPRLVIESGNPRVSVEQLIAESPKLKWTVDKLQVIFEAGEKVILFTKYKRMQSILKYVILEKFGIEADIINGEVSGNRGDLIKHFSKQNGAGAIILSPKAAGVGLTITAANHVIHYTREWNPAVENQATDRVYRIGQEKPVYVYYPILFSNTFLSADSKLDQLLDSKRELMKRVVIPADLNIKIEEFEECLL